mmetsp:Transcript_30999/g.98987  ORF Transcript_30999/g.98987 Transcript_30999/m.98987 type:complete len:207 (-) Transcript_30999:356-976(-)
MFTDMTLRQGKKCCRFFSVTRMPGPLRLAVPILVSPSPASASGLSAEGCPLPTSFTSSWKTLSMAGALPESFTTTCAGPCLALSFFSGFFSSSPSASLPASSPASGAGSPSCASCAPPALGSSSCTSCASCCSSSVFTAMPLPRQPGRRSREATACQGTKVEEYLQQPVVWPKTRPLPRMVTLERLPVASWMPGLTARSLPMLILL